jgi:rhodanese-related sulfurtransferase
MSPVPPLPQSLLLAFLADPSTFALVDARSPEEYAESHIDGAINVPHDRLDEYDEGLPAALDRTVVVYCRTGKRAGRLQAQLEARGYTDVRVLGPDQIFARGGLMVFNCGTQSSESPAGLDTAAVDAREEETKQ